MSRTATTAAAALAVALAGTGEAAAAELPLGPAGMRERRATVAVAPGVRWTRIVRAGRGDGPWRVHVLDVDRSGISGRLAAVLANERVPGLETTSSMARRRGAFAGVNGGYFAPRVPDRGDPVGVLAVDGRLVSEPVAARTALLVPRSPPEPVTLAGLRFRGTATIGDRSRLVDGVDRIPGRIPGCGGLGGDLPTELPNPFLTCRDASELIVLSPRFGSRTAPGARGYEAVVRGGAVTELRRAGAGRIPSAGYVLSGSGDAAVFLRDHARPGARPALRLELADGRRRFEASSFESITSAGPRLVKAGRVSLTTAAEGLVSESGRNPRTLAGVRSDGHVLLVAVDGRRPGFSVGVTVREAARLMLALGAREALNLDSGGSTTMVVGGRVVNRPSDPGGERAVSDGLFVLP